MQFPASIRGLILCLLPAAFAFVASEARGQDCFPDGLQGGTCANPAAIRLPDFPAVSDRVRYVCFESCDPQLDQEMCYSLGAPRS